MGAPVSIKKVRPGIWRSCGVTGTCFREFPRTRIGDVGPFPQVIQEAKLGLGARRRISPQPDQSSSSEPGNLFENPLHNAGSDVELSSDHVDAITFVPQFQYARFDRWLDAPASQFDAVRPSSGQTCIDSFANDSPLELRKHPQHLEHRLARRGRRIEPLLMKE